MTMKTHLLTSIWTQFFLPGSGNKTKLWKKVRIIGRFIVYIPQIHEDFLCAGIPGWSVLVKALQHKQLRQNGIATNIWTQKLSYVLGHSDQ